MVAREVQKRTKRHQRSLPAATLKRKRKGGENEGARSLEVGAREHGLRIFQALLLVDARRLAHVVVLDDEVALRVQVEEQLLDVGQGRLLVHLLLLGGLDLRVEVGLRGLLRRDRLNVLRARLLGAAHEPLVILLRGLLLVLRGGDAVRELLGQHLHEGNDAIALAVRLLVRIPRRGRRRRRGIRALVQLGVDLSLHRGDRSAGDHLRGRGCDHVRPARRGEDLLLLGELLLWRFLVHVRAVELEEAILRLLDELDSGVVLGLEGDEVLVLLLALLGRLRDRLVKRLDLLLEGRDLLRERGAALRHLLDGRSARRDALLRVGLLRVGLLDLRGAEDLRVVVLLLLRLEDLHHPVDLLCDLGEVDLLRLELRLEEGQRRGVARRLGRGRKYSARPQGTCGSRLVLEEDGRGLAEREGLLEEVKRVVVVQDLDGLANSGDLLRAHRLALGPLLLLQSALRTEVGEERLRLLHLRRGVLNVVSGRRNGNRELAAADRLRLDGLRGRGDLLLLRGRQLLKDRRRLLLGRHRALQVAGHLVLHGLQHTNDLAALAAVRAEGVLALQEREELVPLVVVDRLRLLRGLDKQGLLPRALQERLAHALRERVDGARHRLQVGAQVTGRRDVLLVLLLPDRRRLLEVSLGLLTVELVLHELLVKLRLLGFLGRRGHAVGVAVTEAHELVEEALLLLAFGLELLLHVLQNRHDLADRIRFRLQSESFNAAPTAEENQKSLHRVFPTRAADPELEP